MQHLCISWDLHYADDRSRTYSHNLETVEVAPFAGYESCDLCMQSPYWSRSCQRKRNAWLASAEINQRPFCCIFQEIRLGWATKTSACHADLKNKTNPPRFFLKPFHYRTASPGNQTLTCLAHGKSSKTIWIQPCCDSSCPPGRGFLWEKRSPGQSGPLWTCSRHTRVASKPGNTQIAQAGCPCFWCTCKTAKTQPWMTVKGRWKQKQMKRNRICGSTLRNTLWKWSQHPLVKPRMKENTDIRIKEQITQIFPFLLPTKPKT